MPPTNLPPRAPRSTSQAEIACAVLAVVAGSLAWIVPARLSGHLEAWDGHLWWLWLFATGLAALMLGFAGPRRWWLWPLLLCAAQFATMLIQGGVGPLMILGLGFMSAIAGGLMLPAFIGARLRPSRT